MNYSITPLTNIFRENKIPTSPLVKGTSRSTGTYGNVVWYQVKDGYSWSKPQGSSKVDFEVKGREVFDRMITVLNENNIEIEKEQHNYEYGGYIRINLEQFNQ